MGLRNESHGIYSESHGIVCESHGIVCESHGISYESMVFSIYFKEKVIQNNSFFSLKQVLRTI
jgi:hypothetical protein